jgi:hypothetical protein
MVAWIEVAACVEMETTGLRSIEIEKTRMTDKPRNDVDPNQKAGYPYCEECSRTRL